MPQFFWKRIISSVVLSSALYAADGPVSIDQDRAMAGSVTSGDDPGFPVTISQSGVYRLTGNLSVPDNNTTAILITASSVTVDLNGFSIMGPVSCSQDPVVCPEPGKGIGIKSAAQPVQSVKVMNGTVRGMAAAIYEDRAFEQMPILADALEDAGCEDATILNHCRQPGVHVRGCWVIDLLLGKE